MELVLLTVPDPNAAAFVGAPGRRAGRHPAAAGVQASWKPQNYLKVDS